MAAALAAVAVKASAVGAGLGAAVAVEGMMSSAAYKVASEAVVEGPDDLGCLQRLMGRTAHAVARVSVELAVVLVGPADSLQKICHPDPCTALMLSVHKEVPGQRPSPLQLSQRRQRPWMFESALAEVGVVKLARSVLAWSLTSLPTSVQHRWMLYYMIVAEVGRLVGRPAGLYHKSICSGRPELVGPDIVAVLRARVLGAEVAGIPVLSSSLQLPTDLFLFS